MSRNYRARFAADGVEETVVVKLASDDESSRDTGVGMGAYLREVAFYENLAPRLGDSVPDCHFAAYDDGEGWFTLVLADIVGATQGDQIEGCTPARGRARPRCIGADPRPGDERPRAEYGRMAEPAQPAQPGPRVAVLAGVPRALRGKGQRRARRGDRPFLPSLDGWYAEQRPPLGIVHYDYRLDNLLFADGFVHRGRLADGRLGPLDGRRRVLPRDRADDARTAARTRRSSCAAITASCSAQGVQGFGWDDCWEGYRRSCFWGIVITVAAAIVVERTERGDEMFTTVFQRIAQQIIDLDALALLPVPNTARPEPLRPKEEDEGLHPPGPEELWNESYYFDGVADDGSLGVYARVGRLPNRGECLYTACICGPGRATIMLVATVSLPAADDSAQEIAIEGLRATQRCEAPLERFRVTLEGTGEAFDDPSAVLRGESREPVEIAFDLVFDTDGVPFAWRQATRYEIPCRVTGTVRVDGEEVDFAGPGQRDHSWRSRDWWASDWVWSGLHFEDGTHTHAVGVPQLPGFGVGYVQRGGEVLEISSVNTTEQVADNGLVTEATIASGPDELALEVEPLAFGPLLLIAPDGRVSHFVRAMCGVRTGDGRVGSGWVEWNRNQH